MSSEVYLRHRGPRKELSGLSGDTSVATSFKCRVARHSSYSVRCLLHLWSGYVGRGHLLSLGCNLDALSDVVWVGSSGNGLLLGFRSLVRGLLDEVLDLVLVIREKRSEHVVVEDGRSIEVWDQEPDEDKQADDVPVWNIVQEKAEEGLDRHEHAEDHPVGEPHLVVSVGLRVDGKDGFHRGVNHGKRSDQNKPSVHVEHDANADREKEGNWSSWVDSQLLRQVSNGGHA